MLPGGGWPPICGGCPSPKRGKRIPGGAISLGPPGAPSNPAPGRTPAPGSRPTGKHNFCLFEIQHLN